MGRLYIVIQFETVFDRLHELTEGETLIGRGKESALRLASPSVSRRHAMLLNSDNGVRIRDLGSRNGTRKDGLPIHRDELLSNGGAFQIGPYSLTACSTIAEAIRAAGNLDESTRSEFAEPAACMDPKLTPKQRRVYELFLQGLSEKEVAAELGISIHTVHHHSKAIYKALSVSSRGELFARSTIDRDPA